MARQRSLFSLLHSTTFFSKYLNSVEYFSRIDISWHVSRNVRVRGLIYILHEWILTSANDKHYYYITYIVQYSIISVCIQLLTNPVESVDVQCEFIFSWSIEYSMNVYSPLALFWHSRPACLRLIFLCAAVLSAAALRVSGGPTECQWAAEDRRPVCVEHVGKHPRAGTLFFPPPHLPWPFTQLRFNTRHTINPSALFRCKTIPRHVMQLSSVHSDQSESGIQQRCY